MRYIIIGLLLLFSVGVYSQLAGIMYGGPGGAEASPLLDSLFAYYPFEEASGNALDSHNSYDLTVNGPTVEQAGKIDYCYSYITNDYVGYMDNAHFDFAGTFSISFWVKTSYDVAWKCILANYGDATHGYEIIIAPDRVYWRMRNTTSSIVVTGNGTVNDGAWYHYVASYSAVDDTMKLWRNGALDDTPLENVNGVDYNATCRLTIGSQLLGAYFEGYIDEVAIYRGLELTHAQVLELYNSGSGLAYPLDY